MEKIVNAKKASLSELEELNEVKIESSKTLNELKENIAELKYVQGSGGIYSADEVSGIIDALNSYYNKAYAGASPKLLSEIVNITSAGEDPFTLLTRTFDIRGMARYLIYKRIAVNETYAKLREGDLLPSSSIKRYGLVMPSYKNPYFVTFKKYADTYAFGYEGKIRAQKLLQYVYSNIEPRDGWTSKPVVSLSEAIEKRVGVCKEKAAILYMLLNTEGYDVYYVRGTEGEGDETGRHAWLKLNLGGESYLLDPTLNRFGKYNSVMKTYNYGEGENLIIKGFGAKVPIA